MKTTRALGFLGLAAAALLALPGCKAKLNGNLTVNGAEFKPTACRNGEPLGFSGVELSDAAGNRLRLMLSPTGQPAVFYGPAGAAMLAPVAVCGSINHTRANSQINNVYNVQGHASLDGCAGQGVVVGGSIDYANCH